MEHLTEQLRASEMKEGSYQALSPRVPTVARYLLFLGISQTSAVSSIARSKSRCRDGRLSYAEVRINGEMRQAARASACPERG